MDEKTELEIFNELYTNYRNPFIRFANSYIRDISVAEDFVADSLVGYWENRHTLTPDTNPCAYILTSIKNKCLNHLQHLQVRQDAIEKLKDLAQRELNARISTLQVCDPNEIFSIEVQEIVKKTLQKLPEKTRTIFRMSREENLSHSEIARQTGLSAKSVEFHISKAIKALRIALKEYLPTVLLWMEIYLFKDIH